MATRNVMQARATRHKLARRKAKVANARFDNPATYVGKTDAGVEVYFEDSLGQDGLSVAKAILPLLDDVLCNCDALFQVTMQQKDTVVVANLSGDASGWGGAYHWGCSDQTYYADCCKGNPNLTLALVAAEAAESRMAVAGGWNCGESGGEGVSRFAAEYLCPAQLGGYETASAWLDSNRPNWIDTAEGTDTDDLANGANVLFLWWMVQQSGFTAQQICSARVSTPAQLYASLTGRKTAWQDFSAACQAAWPSGTPSGVAKDDCWPVAPSPSPTPTPTPTPGGSLPPTLAAYDENGSQVGTYLLVTEDSLAGLTTDQLDKAIHDAVKALVGSRRKTRK